jgi:hypothetical protein
VHRGAGVRAIAATEARAAPVTDPLRDLEHAIATGDTPAWLLRHAPDGDAALARAWAWATSAYATRMRWLAVRGRRRISWPGEWLCDDEAGCPSRWRGEDCPDCADAIRRDVPTPPLTWAEMTGR